LRAVAVHTSDETLRAPSSAKLREIPVGPKAQRRRIRSSPTNTPTRTLLGAVPRSLGAYFNGHGVRETQQTSRCTALMDHPRADAPDGLPYDESRAAHRPSPKARERPYGRDRK